MRIRSFMLSIGIAISGCAAEATDELELTEENDIPAPASTEASSPLDKQTSQGEAKELPSLHESALCFNRSGFLATALVSTGHYGSWAGCIDFCPEGSWVWSINTRWDCQGGGSDCSGTNTIMLGCHDRAGNYVASISSSAGWWGYWSGWYTTRNGGPAKGMETFTMPKRGSRDDMSMTVAYLLDSGGSMVGESSGFHSGDVWARNECPAGTRVCGLQTRLEAKQGTRDDDTALNGVNLACCSF